MQGWLVWTKGSPRWLDDIDLVLLHLHILKYTYASTYWWPLSEHGGVQKKGSFSESTQDSVMLQHCYLSIGTRLNVEIWPCWKPSNGHGLFINTDKAVKSCSIGRGPGGSSYFTTSSTVGSTNEIANESFLLVPQGIKSSPFLSATFQPLCN